MFNKILTIMLCISLIIIGVVGCNSKMQPTLSNKIIKRTGTVKLWGDSNIDSNLYNQFNEDTGYKIEKITSDIDSDNNNLEIAINSGVRPDVAFINMDDVIKLGVDDFIWTLDNFIDKDEELNIEDFYKFYMDLSEYENKHYSFPWDIEYSIFYWDKDMFEEAGLDPDIPPKDWKQILDYSKLLTNFNSNGDIIQLGLKFPKDANSYFNTLLMANDGSIISSDGKNSTVNSPEVIETFGFILELMNNYSNSKLSDEETFHFLNGNVAMTISDVTKDSYIAYEDNKNIGMCVPPPPEGKSAITNGWANMAVVLPKKSSNPQGGYEFAKWIVTKGLFNSLKAQMEDNPDNVSGKLIPHIELNKELDSLVSENCNDQYKLKQRSQQKNVYENYIKVFPNTPATINYKFDVLWNGLVRGDKSVQDAIVEWDNYNTNSLNTYYKKNLGVANK